MACPHTRRGGFSLIELVITVAIGSILLAVAMPSLQSFLGDGRISGTTNDFVFALQSARSEAIKRAVPAELCASRAPLAATARCDGASYASGWIVYADDDGSLDRDAGEAALLRVAPPPRGFGFDASDARIAARLRFDDTGASVGDAGGPLAGSVSIAHPSAEERRRVAIAASGRIRTETVR